MDISGLINKMSLYLKYSIPADSSSIPVDSSHSCRNVWGSEKYWVESMDFTWSTWSLHGVYMDSSWTPHKLHKIVQNLGESPRGIYGGV